MKKSVFSFLAAIMLLFAIPATVTAVENSNENEANAAISEMALEVKTLVNRLGEIKAMDLSELSSAEKKELRKEVRSIGKELNAYSKADSEARANADATAQGSQAGLYISGSAIIIILILLLLLR